MTDKLKKGQTNQHPFTPMTLEEDKIFTPEKVFSVRLNQEEALWLNEIKKDLNIKADGKALKLCAIIGKNVLLNTFGKQNLRYLFKKGREKLTDFENY